MRVAVLGAGAAGLAAARLLQKKGAEVLAFEAEPRAGGKISSAVQDGFCCEGGPNAIAPASPTALRLTGELGLRVVEARSPRARFVFRRAVMRRAPSLGLLSPFGWGRALMEPLTVRRKPEAAEESLWDFFVRHFGEEAGGLAARLMAAGVYAGDPRQLSVGEAFRKIAALEEAGRGSLLLGVLRSGGRKDKQGPRSLWSLEGGLGQLPAAMSAQLGGALRLSTRASQVQTAGRGYRLRLSGEGAGEVEVDGLLCALPAGPAAQALGGLAPGLARLTEIRSSPIAVVHLGFRAEDLARRPEGFGVLDGEGSLGILGTLFPSSLFADRAPENHLLLTTLLGGLQQPEVMDLGDEALESRCLQSVQRLFGVVRPPVFRRVVRWSAAVPQPELGHASRIAAARAGARGLPPLELAGAALDGVAVEQALAGGERAAERLWARLNGAHLEET